MSIDFNRAAMLLHVCDKSKNWPNLRKLHDAAMAELVDMQEPEEKPQPAPASIRRPIPTGGK